MTRVFRDPREFQEHCINLRDKGQRLGLVPTMGALHAGHHSLIEAANAATDSSLVTIFVNPLQFAPDEDLERYPRNFESDLGTCEERGVNAVFAPPPAAMYPQGFQTAVEVGELTQPLEGQHRPEHFVGVTTVVAKLLILSGECSAFFGRKDYQQFRVLERMVQDLHLPIEMIACPIVRESDGLALSSRNRYLSAEERHRALGIVTGLRAAWDAWQEGEHSPEQLQELARKPVTQNFDSIDYVSVCDPLMLQPAEGTPQSLLVAVAAQLDGTRLIDNVVLGEDPRP